MSHKFQFKLTDAQWVELKTRATSQRTNPATMIKRLLFPKVKAVEKRGTYEPVSGEPLVTVDPALMAIDLSDVGAPTIPVRCSFCGDSSKVWLNGNEIPCPKCGMRVEVTE